MYIDSIERLKAQVVKMTVLACMNHICKILYPSTLWSLINLCLTNFRQGFSLTPTSSGQLQFPLINMSQLKAHLDKNVKLEPVESSKGETTAGSVVTSAITLPAAQVT